jgi:hypothetical protein
MRPNRVNAPVVAIRSKRLCVRAFGLVRGNGSAMSPITPAQTPTTSRICFARPTGTSIRASPEPAARLVEASQGDRHVPPAGTTASSRPGGGGAGVSVAVAEFRLRPSGVGGADVVTLRIPEESLMRLEIANLDVELPTW